MKCIQCGTDNNLRDRTANNGRCKNCEHPFAFEPASREQKLKLTDTFFAKAIADISAENTLFFTFKQFIYFLDKRLKYKSFTAAGCLVPFFYLFFNFWFTGFVGGFTSFIFGNSSFPLALWTINLIFVIYFIRQINSRQLTYAVRKNKAKSLLIIGILILIIGFVASLVVLQSFIFFTLFTLLGMSAIYLGLIKLRTIQPLYQDFIFTQSQASEWINRWTTINGIIQRKLTPPSERASSNSVNPEISSYSFDRLVVCNSSEIAQFLIANNFPFENNCAVLSITRYPQDIFDTVMEMLRRNPELKVYALHDASPSGVSLVHQLRTDNNWFTNQSVTIYDIGILPRQVLKNPNCFICNSNESATEAKRIIPEVKQQLTPDELEWLEKGNFVELESFSPKKLLQLVNRGISLSRSPDNQDNLMLLGDDDEFNRTGVFIYSVDTFG